MREKRITDIAPLLAGLVIFTALAIWDHSREFYLWRNYALSGIVLGGMVIAIVYRYDVRIPHYIQIIIIGAMLTHYGGGSLGSPDPYRMGLLGTHGINGAYHTYDWWDHLTHGAGIGAGAMAFAFMLELYQTRRGLEWSASGLWILTMIVSLAAGVAVELYEFLGKTAFQTIDQGGYENTMRDLHFNFLGATIGGGIAVTVNRSRFREAIEEQWGTPVHVAKDAPWYDKTTPAMVGVIVFCALPAFTAIFLMTRFFAQEIPPDDLHLYDPALQLLTAATAIALVLAPLAAIGFKTYRERA